MSRRFVFVGNRRFVLEEMIRQGLDLAAVYIISGTHLERDFEHGLFPQLGVARIIHSKSELLALLRELRFDVLLSNGCPYILPISELPSARYVNIHPSCLPDLRGADPAIGAVLLGRDAGATCHVMDEGIDTGDIIAQVRIPFTEDLDVSTLYQLSFIAEKNVFLKSLAREFEPAYSQEERPELVYYSRKPEDRVITFTEPNNLILRKIKAYNNRSQGCEFVVGGRVYRVYSATRLFNSFLMDYLAGFADCTVALSYENSIAFRKDGEVLRFENIHSQSGIPLAVNDSLLSP